MRPRDQGGPATRMPRRRFGVATSLLLVLHLALTPGSASAQTYRPRSQAMATVFTSTLIGWGLGGFVAVISLLADTSGQVNERTVFAATTGVGLAAGAILVASGRGLHLERPPGPFVMTMEGLLTGFCVGTAYAATQHRRMEDWGNEILVFTGIGTAAGLVLGLLDQPTAPPAADQPPPKVVIEPSPGGGLRVGARLNFTLKTN